MPRQTSTKLQSLPDVEDYLILLTDGLINRGLTEVPIVDTYLRELIPVQASRLYYIGFGKEHSAHGLNTLDRGNGNYFSVFSGDEATAIAAAEIIFRIAKPGPRNVALSVRQGNGKFYDANKNEWVSEINMGMLTPGRSIEFYTRIPQSEDESLIEYKFDGTKILLVPLEGHLTTDEAMFSELRLDALKMMAEIKERNQLYSAIDYLSRQKKDCFQELYQRANAVLKRIEESAIATAPETVDLQNDVKTCLLTMGGHSSISSLYSISRLNAQWYGTCMRNKDIAGTDVTAHMYDYTGLYDHQPGAPVAMNRQMSEATPRCISDCMRALSQQPDDDEDNGRATPMDLEAQQAFGRL
jgi:hypothetical protein